VLIIVSGKCLAQNKSIRKLIVPIKKPTRAPKAIKYNQTIILVGRPLEASIKVNEIPIPIRLLILEF
jgi:hypothetical protein